jgi:mannosyltransferase
VSSLPTLIETRAGRGSVARRDAARRSRSVPLEVWAVAAITLAAAALRFATLGTQSYWLDEATTAHEVGLSFGALLHQVRVNETTPPLYFVVAWVWAKLFGTGAVGLRSLSALAGIAAVPVTYLAGRELVSRRAGLLAALFAALSPFMIWYSQEARSYMLFGLFCGMSLLFCARAWRRGAARDVWLWALCSALAIATHFFAGFLVAPEAAWLLYVARRRGVVWACAAIALVQLAVLPLAIGDTSHPLGWIQAFPLSTRLQQIPVDLGLSSLYQSSIVNYGLVGAAVLAAFVVALLVIGGGTEERRGAAFAGALAACVILVPIVLAEVGRDYVVPRNFMPAWIPLAIVLGAACTVPRARFAGATIAVALLIGFVWAGIRIDTDAQYQRPDWRGVASALGRASVRRAIVAYDGGYATGPLAVYLPGVPWARPGPGLVQVSEVDVVGSSWQTIPRSLPDGARLLGTRSVAGGYLVARFAVRPAWHATPAAILVRAQRLLVPAPVGAAVVFQSRAIQGTR